MNEFIVSLIDWEYIRKTGVSLVSIECAEGDVHQYNKDVCFRGEPCQYDSNSGGFYPSMATQKMICDEQDMPMHHVVYSPDQSLCAVVCSVLLAKDTFFSGQWMYMFVLRKLQSELTFLEVLE